MKNLFSKYSGILSLFSFLFIFPIQYAHSQNIDELFGIKLLDNASNYVSSDFIESNKIKNVETISGYWDLDISDQLTNPYFDRFYLIIDDYNKIHSIQADKDCPSEDTCFTYQDKFVKKVEKKKQIKLKKGGQDELNFRTNFFGYSGNDIYLSITCTHMFDPISNTLIYFISTETHSIAVDEFYNQY